MYRSKIILSGNIGLGFSRKSDSHTQNNRSETYQKIHDTLKYVFNKYDEKKPAVLAIQELGNLELTPRPFFENPPLATDIKTLQKLGDGGRGVGIYSRSPEAVQLDTESEDDEIAAIIEPYVNPKGHKKKVCIINVYRLTNKDHERSISDTTDRIKKIIAKARQVYNVRNVIVLGDFNDESKIYLGPSFRELKNNDLFHRHSEHPKNLHRPNFHELF